MDTPVSPRPRRMLQYIILSLVGVVFATTLLLFIYQNTSAAENISGSFARMKDVRSFTAEVKILDNAAKMKIDYHKNPSQYTRVTMQYNELNFQKNDRLRVETVVNNKDLYVTLHYTHMKEIVRMLKSTYLPDLEQLKAYSLLRPFLFNSRPLHVPIETILEAQQDVVEQAVDVQANAELNQMLMNAMIIRPSRWRGSFSRIGPTVYKIGFKKDRLLAYVDRLKTFDEELTQEEYEALKEFISASDNWDADLIILELDRKGNLEEIEVYAPSIPKQIVDRYISQPSQTNISLIPFGAAFQNAAEKFSKNRNKRKNEARTKLLEIEIEHYNNAPRIKPPARSIEAEDIFLSFQQQERIPTASPTPTSRFLPRP